LNQVFDRRTKRLVEELIDMKIVLSMRAIYQSKAGLALIDVGVCSSAIFFMLSSFLYYILSRGPGIGTGYDLITVVCGVC
jgi:hypothetical protein